MGVLLLPKVGIEINQAMKIDSYLLEKDSIINPDENYIISRDKQGNVVSYYKDDIWDFKYYKSNSKSSEKIFFEKIHTKEIRKEAKRLIFIIMAFKKGKGSSAISNNTLISLYYNSMIVPISIYSIKENIFMKEFFEDSNHILKYINNFCTNTNQIIILRSIKISIKAPDNFAKFLTFGIIFQLSFQTLLNLAVVVGLVPVTGVTLPFFSYGGSSLIITLISIGIILNISRYREN